MKVYSAAETERTARSNAKLTLPIPFFWEERLRFKKLKLRFPEV